VAHCGLSRKKIKIKNKRGKQRYLKAEHALSTINPKPTAMMPNTDEASFRSVRRD